MSKHINQSKDNLKEYNPELVLERVARHQFGPRSSKDLWHQFNL